MVIVYMFNLVKLATLDSNVICSDAIIPWCWWECWSVSTLNVWNNSTVMLQLLPLQLARLYAYISIPLGVSILTPNRTLSNTLTNYWNTRAQTYIHWRKRWVRVRERLPLITLALEMRALHSFPTSRLWKIWRKPSWKTGVTYRIDVLFMITNVW